MAAELIRHSAEFVWQQAISIVESAQYNSAESAHAADSSHKLFYIMPLQLEIGCVRARVAPGWKQKWGGQQREPGPTTQTTVQKAAFTRFLLSYVLQAT